MTRTFVLKHIPGGGLGNQMFEWAAGFRIARELNLPYRWVWEPTSKRKYGLELFGLKREDAPDYKLLMDQRRFRDTETVWEAMKRVEESVHPFPAVSAPFQSEGCFEPVAGEIREIFKLDPIRVKSPLDRTLVGVHVRRGDFVHHPQFNVCGRGYFHRAFDYMRRNTRSPFFVVVSDDVEWCKRALRNGKDVKVMDQGTEERDLRILAGCDAHVISNSTFGWWGAWLGEKGPVVAPKQWCRTEEAYGPWNPVPERWHTLSVGQETDWRVKAYPVKEIESTGLDRAIAIPWSVKHAKWEELRFCLRSIQKFFEDKECPIYLLGNERPGFLLHQEGRVRFINKFLYREALETGVQLAEKVLWMNDDQVFVRPSSWEDWENPLYVGKVAPKLGKVDPRNTWWKGVMNSLDILKGRGIKEPKIYSTHTPYVYRKEQAMKVLGEFGAWEKMPLEMLLFNMFPEGSRKMTTEQTKGLPFGDAKVLCYNNELLTGELKSAIAELLPDFAPWELNRPFQH